MGKKTFSLLIILTAFLLSGCAKSSDTLSTRLKEESGITENTNYQEYEQYKAAGRLDTDGNYTEPEPDTEDAIHAGVHVTFAANSNLLIHYYSDAAHRTLIDTNDCYLQSGESIHAVVEVDRDVFSSMYSFSGFRVYECGDAGVRQLSAIITMDEVKGDYILRIPASYSGKEIAVEPVGQYNQRTIYLRDYYLDDKGQEQELAGTWIVNNKEYTSDAAEISPVSPYIVSYDYDSSEYFFLASSPDYYYLSNADGTVIFSQRNPEDETPDYSVCLKKYLTITLVSDVARTVTINGGEEKHIGANRELTIPHLKYGDVITIQTDRTWTDLEKSRELLLTNTEPLASGSYRYTLIVPEKGGEFSFNPADYSYEHGRITFKCFGQAVTTTQLLAKGSKIYYEQATADDGYWLAVSKGNNFITVGDEEDTVAALKAIHFTPKVKVTVYLPQPEAGGTVEYKLKGKTLRGNSCSTYSGETITMRFRPWQGWITSISGEATYTVGDSMSQTITAKGLMIQNIFTEDSNHMPALSVHLEKSVGDTMEFALEAAGYKMEAVKHASGWNITDLVGKNAGNYNIITNEQTIIADQVIGTAQPIQIRIANRALMPDTAVRMVITKTDRSKNNTVELRYLDDLSEAIEPIYIYNPGTNANSKTWYSTIDISIGVVDIMRFEPATAGPHMNITVANTTSGKRLTKGDLLEPAQEILITATPQKGYYLTGKGVTNGSYSEKMKYSDYPKKITSIINGHPTEKCYSITLDRSDSFASYAYELDGTKVSGTVYAREGQTLELTYIITDPGYQLTKAYGGFIGIGASRTEAKAEIKITSEMDGKTITKADFGIETRKGG